MESSEVELGTLSSTLPLVNILYIDDVPGWAHSFTENDVDAFVYDIKPRCTGYIIRRIGAPGGDRPKRNSSNSSTDLEPGPVDEDGTWDQEVTRAYRADLGQIRGVPHRLYLFSRRSLYPGLSSVLWESCQGIHMMHKHDQAITGFKALSTVKLSMIATARAYFGCATVRQAVSSCQSLTITKVDRIRTERLIFEFYDYILTDFNRPTVALPDAHKTDVAIEYILILFRFLSACLGDFEPMSDELKVRAMTEFREERFMVTNASHTAVPDWDDGINFLVKIVSGNDMIVVSSELISVHLYQLDDEGLESYVEQSGPYKRKGDLISRLMRLEYLPIMLSNGPTTGASIYNVGTRVDPQHEPLFPLTNVRAEPDANEFDRVPWDIY